MPDESFDNADKSSTEAIKALINDIDKLMRRPILQKEAFELATSKGLSSALQSSLAPGKSVKISGFKRVYYIEPRHKIPSEVVQSFKRGDMNLEIIDNQLRVVYLRSGQQFNYWVVIEENLQDLLQEIAVKPNSEVIIAVPKNKSLESGDIDFIGREGTVNNIYDEITGSQITSEVYLRKVLIPDSSDSYLDIFIVKLKSSRFNETHSSPP